MQTYRRKSGTVEAVEITKSNADEIIEWSKGYVTVSDLPGVLHVNTPSGFVRARVGDYIIKNGDDDFYPTGPDKFRELYEKA